jgi:hypothetical protein
MKFLIKPLVLQYKKMASDHVYKDIIFNLIRTDRQYAERFCRQTIKQIGFILSQELMQNLTVRDIAVIKRFFEVYSLLITENTHDNTDELCKFFLNKTKQFFMQCVFFLNESEFCSERLYWKHCYDSTKHTETMYTCDNFKNCLMVTNCLELSKFHHIFSPTIESATNYQDVNSRFHYTNRCPGQGFLSLSPTNEQQKQRMCRAKGLNWMRGLKTGQIHSLFDLYGENFAKDNLLKTDVFTRINPFPIQQNVILFPDEDFLPVEAEAIEYSDEEDEQNLDDDVEVGTVNLVNNHNEIVDDNEEIEENVNYVHDVVTLDDDTENNEEVEAVNDANEDNVHQNVNESVVEGFAAEALETSEEEYAQNVEDVVQVGAADHANNHNGIVAENDNVHQ